MRLALPSRLLFVLLLVLSAPPVARAAGGPGVPSFAPDEPGPFAVGRATFSAVDPDRMRTLPVDVWYPVDDEDAVGDASAYDLIFTQLVSPRAFDAPEASEAGPFPLVVFSHGNNGIRFQSFFLAEQLASHGFVVAAPDHVGNTAVDLLGGGPPFTVTDRPLDVSLVITRMLERSADPGDPLFGRVDAERVGVAGHSFGGFTTLAMAAGFDTVLPDPRVRAIVPISPVSTAFTAEQLRAIDVPTLLVGGTADTTTPIDPQTTFAFANVGGRPLLRMDVHDAGHNSFTDICAIGDALITGGLPPSLLDFLLGNLADGCAPDLIPIADAQRLTNRYVVAFFRVKLASDARYKRFLVPGRAPEQVTFLFATAKGCGFGGAPLALVALLVVARAPRRRTR